MTGGDDPIAGRDSSSGENVQNGLYGDAYSMSGDARGGDDRMIAGTASSDMWGDAALMQDGALGGQDTFVFAGSFGETRIHDFRQGEDRLDIDVDPGLDPFAQISWITAGSDVVVTVAGPESSGTVRLAGFTGTLTGSDFYFV